MAETEQINKHYIKILAEDPVIKFMCSRRVPVTIDGAMKFAPWSRLSASRVGKVGLKLMWLRAEDLELREPTVAEALEVERTVRENEREMTRGELVDFEDQASRSPA